MNVLIAIFIFVFAFTGCQADTTGSKSSAGTTVSEFTIILDSNNGSDETDDIHIEIKNRKAKWTVVGCPFASAEGATFLRWNEASDGSGISYEVSDDVLFPAKQCSITLYAVWKVEVGTYKVHYDANYGSLTGTGSMNDSIFLINQKKFLAKCAFVPDDPLISFNGWNTQADGSGFPISLGRIRL